MKQLLFSAAIFLLFVFNQCQVPNLRQEGGDPDIVLVNVENGDRAFIAQILSKIDSLRPVVVGIDVNFKGPKDPQQDSILAETLRKLKNEFLIYNINNHGLQSHSIPLFTKAVEGEGLVTFQRTNGLISTMKPLFKYDNQIHESFALKLAKRWKPELNITIQVNESIPIEYSRTMDKYLTISGSDLIEIPMSQFDLPHKLILVGYIGPSTEDMYSTPLRFLSKKKLQHNEPDTYGLVIIANQIRTILNRK